MRGRVRQRAIDGSNRARDISNVVRGAGKQPDVILVNMRLLQQFRYLDANERTIEEKSDVRDISTS